MAIQKKSLISSLKAGQKPLVATRGKKTTAAQKSGVVGRSTNVSRIVMPALKSITGRVVV